MFFCAIFNSDSRAYNIRSLPAHEAGAEQRHKGDCEDNTHGAGHALDQFNGHGVAVDDLDEGIAVDLKQQQHIQGRARKSQDQGVRHGAHDVPSN